MLSRRFPVVSRPPPTSRCRPTGQVDRLWIQDVDGARLVIDAFDMPSATDAERQELLDVVASIRFLP